MFKNSKTIVELHRSSLLKKYKRYIVSNQKQYGSYDIKIQMYKCRPLRILVCANG